MMYGTYQRLRVHVGASNIAVIRAARKKLAKRCWHDSAYRDGRKLFYRNMLEYHADAQRMVREWRL